MSNISNEFMLELVAIMDRKKSRVQINRDIKEIEKAINKIKLVGTIAKGETKTELNQMIKQMEAQLRQVKLQGKMDSRQLNRELDNALKNMSAKDIQLNLDSSGERLNAQVRRAVSRAKDFVERNTLSLNIDLRKEKLANQLTTFLNKYTKINESPYWLDEVDRLRAVIASVTDHSGLKNATDQFQVFTSGIRATGYAAVSTADRIKRMLGSVLKIGNYFGVAVTFISEFRKSLNSLKEMDTLLTEISKTSEVASRQLEELGDRSYAIASKYGVLANNFMKSFQEMSRAGFGEDKAQSLAELATLAQSAGNLTAELSNEYLIASNAAYGYSGSVEKLNALLDAQNQVTNRNAVSLTELADATKVAANQLANAAISEQEMTALLGTGIATTKESGQVVGRAVKAIIMNLQQVQNTEEGLETTAEDLNKVESCLDSLGIKMKETADGITRLRKPISILSELAEVYNSLPKDSVERVNIISDIGGKYRGNVLSSILSNWETYIKMLGDYEDAEGSALREAEKSADSWEGRLAQLQNTWDSFVSSMTNKEAIKRGISFLDGMIQHLTKFTDAVGAIPVLLTAINTGMTVLNKNYGISQFINSETKKIDIRGNIMGFDISAYRNQTKHFKEASIAMGSWNEQLVDGIADINTFNNAVVKNNAQLQEYLKTTSANAPASLNGYKAYLNAAGVSTDALRIKTILLNSALTFGISFAINTAVKVLSDLIVTADEARESSEALTKAMSDFRKEVRDGNRTLSSVSARYEELRKGVNSLGENVSLTTEEHEEYLDICSQLADLMPDMVSYWNREGDAIIDTTKSITELTEAYKENMRVKASQFLLHGDEDGNTIDSILKNYRNMVDGDYWYGFNPLTSWMRLDENFDSFVGVHGRKKIAGLLEEAYSKDYAALMQMLEESQRKWSSGMRSSYEGALASLLSDHGYKNISEITQGDFGAIHDMLYSTLTALKAEEEEAASQITGIMQQMLFASKEYTTLQDSTLQDSIQKFLQSINSDFITLKGLDTQTGIRSFMSSFLSAVSNEKGEAAKALISLFDADTTAAGIRNALATVGKTIGADTGLLSKMLGLDDTLNSDTKIKVMISNAVERILKASGKTFRDSIEELRECGNLYEELESLMAANGIHTVDQMTLWMRELEKSGYDMQEAFRNYAASTKESISDAFRIDSHSEAIDSFQSKVKTLSDALSKLNSGEITSNDLTDLAQEFMSLDMASDTLASDIESLIYESLTSLISELDNPPEELKELLKGIAEEAVKAANGVTSLSSSIQAVIDTHSLLENVKDDLADGKISAANLQKIASSYQDMEEAVVAYSAGLLSSKELYEELKKQYGKDLEAFQATNQSKAYDSELYYQTVLAKEQDWAKKMQSQYYLSMSDFSTVEEAKTAYLERAFGDRKAIWENYYQVIRGEDGQYELRATGELKNLTGTNRIAVEKAKATVQQFLKDLNDMFSADFDLAELLEEEAKEAETKKNVFDWMETKLERIQRKLKQLGEAVSDAFSGYASRKDALSEKINATVTEELPALEQALLKYQELASSVDLSETYKERIRSGELLVEYGTDSTTADRIAEYEKWHDKILDTQDAIEECRESLKEMNAEWMSMEESAVKGTADAITRAAEQSQRELEKAAYSGADTADTYDTIIRKQGELADAYREGAEAMQDILSQMEAEGVIERHSEKWEELTGKIENYISLSEQAELAAKKAAEDRFADISARHGRILAEHEHEANMLDKEIAMAKEKGYLNTAASYNRLIENEMKILGQNTMKRDDLERELAMLENAGIAEGSERWHELNSEILSTNEAIADSELKLTEWANAIRQVKWDIFDFLHDQIAQVSEEADFLIKLMEGRTHEDNGQLTDTGLASAALHKTNYDLYVKEAQAYAEELERIEAAIAADPNDTESIKRWGELAEARRKYILAAEDEKQAIIDLVSEGIKLELESLDSLIDKYKDALDAQKDLYDYQKKTASQSKDIAKLQKLLAAYENDKSEEARAKIQKIRVQLTEAQSDMEDYQYDHYISEQKELLSSLYEAYKETLEKRLDDTEAVFRDMTEEINRNTDTIASTIKGETNRVNYQISYQMEHLWGRLDGTIEDGTGSIEDATQQGNGLLSWIGGNLSDWKDSEKQENAELLAAQTEGMAAIKDSVDAVRDSVDSYFAQMLTQWDTLTDKICGIEASMLGILESALTSGNQNTETTNSSTSGNSNTQGNDSSGSTGNGNGTQQKPSASSTVNFIPKDDSVPKNDLDTEHSIVDLLKWHDYDSSFEARKKYYREMGYTDTYYGTDVQNRNMLSWMEANGYASGLYRAGIGAPKILQKTSVPLLQENMARQFMNLTAVNAMVADLRDTAESPMWNVNASLPSAETITTLGNTIENKMDVQFVLPNVSDYNSFLREMQKDRRFEQMVQDMTINRLSGGGVMDKYRHRF